MRPMCARPKTSGTSAPRTIVTSPLASPNSSAKPISTGTVLPMANRPIASGIAASTTTPSTRSDTPRPTSAWAARPATCAGPNHTSTASACASLKPLAANAGITWAQNAAETKV